MKSGDRSPAERRTRRPLLASNTILFSLALVKLLVHLLTAGNYGYFRDELYYIAASERLGLGYVDFPPFVALATALARATLGDSLWRSTSCRRSQGPPSWCSPGSWRGSSGAAASPRAWPHSRSSSRPTSSCSGRLSRWTPSTSYSGSRPPTCCC